MKILVTFAVEAEFAPWRKLRKFENCRVGDAAAYCTQIGESKVAVVLTGISAKSPWLTAVRGVEACDCDVCISSGLAGALRGEWKPGDVLAARMVQAEGKAAGVAGDAELLRIAVRSGAREAGSFFSAGHVVLSAVEKAELGRNFDAVEMESAAVLEAMGALRAKGIAIRGISDAADEDLPLDFNRVVSEAGEVSMPRVLGEVLKNPTAIPALMRFGQQSKLAAEKLCAFLDGYVQALATEWNAAAKGAIAK